MSAAEARPTATPTTWRKIIKVHPLADLFPMIIGEEFEAMVASIRAHRVKMPLVFRRESEGVDPVLLDGRNRLDAIEKAFGPVVWVASGFGFEVQGPAGAMPLPHRIETGGDPLAIVVSLNILRRHLSGEDKRVLITELLKANPARSDRSTGKILHVDNKTVASVRTELEAREEIPHVDKRTDAKGRSQPSTKPVSASPRDMDKTGRANEAGNRVGGDGVSPPATKLSRSEKRYLKQQNDLAELDQHFKKKKKKQYAARARDRAAASPSQQRDKAIDEFSKVLHKRLLETLDDLTRLLGDAQQRIIEIPIHKRKEIARKYLRALGVIPDDLRQDDGTGGELSSQRVH